MAETADAGRDVAFRMMGPLRVTRGDAAVPLGGRQQRAVLARLLLADGGRLSVEQLVDALRGEHIPPGESAWQRRPFSCLKTRGGARDVRQL